MKIKREVNGNVLEFELTGNELFDAFVEQEHSFDVDNVNDWLAYNTPEREFSSKDIDALAWEVRRQINKYDVSFDYAVDEARLELGIRIDGDLEGDEADD